MSTLPIRSLQVPQVLAHASPLPGLARLGAIAMAVIDTYSEALRLTHEVHKNYPFIAE
jgi:hypothetical protein